MRLLICQQWMTCGASEEDKKLCRHRCVHKEIEDFNCTDHERPCPYPPYAVCMEVEVEESEYVNYVSETESPV